MERLYALTNYEKDTLLRFFFYYMGTENRERLMREHSLIYNNLYGKEIMIVEKAPEKGIGI